jgi:hypothetical protein
LIISPAISLLVAPSIPLILEKSLLLIRAFRRTNDIYSATFKSMALAMAILFSSAVGFMMQFHQGEY